MILEEKHYRAVELLLSGVKNDDVANEIGVNVNTLYSWKKKPEFDELLNGAKREAVKKAQLVFSVKAEYAAKRIVEMIDDKDATTVQLKAAMKVVDSAFGGSIEEFEERLEELEEAQTREV